MNHLLPVFSFAAVVLLPKNPGTLTDGSVENSAMHPNLTANGRPSGQRGRQPGRRKTKEVGSWSQKSSLLRPAGLHSTKEPEPVKFPKKRGPKPGSRV